MAIVIPRHFRLPWAASATGGQRSSADNRDMNVLRRITIILFVVPNVGSVVPGRVEKGLTLRRHFLEIGIVGGRIVRIPRPRAAQLLGNIIRGHSTEYVAVEASTSVNIDKELSQAGSHRNRLFDIQTDFAFALGVGPSSSGAAIQNYVGDRDVVGLLDTRKVQADIARGIA